MITFFLMIDNCRYECDEFGKQLKDGAGVQTDRIVSTCTWYGNYTITPETIDTDTLQCVCKLFMDLMEHFKNESITGTHCLSPPQPPNNTYLVSYDWEGDPVPVGQVNETIINVSDCYILSLCIQNITYRCLNGMMSNDTLEDALVTAVCQDGNTFTLDPPDWPVCVPSKSTSLTIRATKTIL